MVVFSLLVLVLSLFLGISATHAAAVNYTYDNLYRLTKVDYGNGIVIEYTYDAAGNRASHKVSHQVAPVNSFTPVGDNVTVSPVIGAIITFSGVTSSGYTSVNNAGSGNNPPAGFQIGRLPANYDITTTAAYTSPVVVCMEYGAAQFGNSNMLHLFHYENNAWVDVTTSNDTANHVICGQVNSLSPFAIFEADTTPPVITASVSSPPNVSGWHNSDVDVIFGCSDSGTGIDSCPAPVTVTTDGSGQAITGTAIDKAGNSASASVIINLDKTPPVLTCPPDTETIATEPAGTPSLNLQIQSFLAGVSASDNLSSTGAVTNNAPVFFPTGQTPVTFTSVDGAGNHGTCTAVITVKNPAPVFEPVADKAVNEGQLLSFTVSASDASKNLLTYSASGLPTGATFDPASRAFSYIPGYDASTHQTDSFFDVFFSVSDGATTVSMPVRITVHNVNRSSVANAGADQNVQTDSAVTLDGSASSDPDGDLITFNWLETNKPLDSTAALSDSTIPNPAFTPDKAGYYSYDIVVCDFAECSGPDSVMVYATTPNVPPNANAGTGQSVLTGLPVLLDGSASNDPDNGPSPMSYLWGFVQVPAGSSLRDTDITGQGLPLAGFVPDLSGVYKLDLSVSDGADTSHAQTVITASVNVPPTANAGLDQIVLLGQKVTLDGLGSYDPDNRPQPITYQWSFVSVPAGSSLTNASLTGVSTSSAAFTPDLTGSYVIQLTVSDGQDVVTDNMAITVIQPKANSNGSSSYFSEGGYNAYATFDVKYSTGSANPSGSLTFTSTKTRRKIVSTGITSLTVTGKSAVIKGPCTLNGISGYSFTATVGDNATPGAGSDTFAITVTGPNGFNYTASGTIVSGEYVVGF